MALYDYDHLVSVPGATLTTFRTACTTEAGIVGHSTAADMLNKVANAALPVDNRFLATVRSVYQYAKTQEKTALRDAAKAVLDQATGIA